MQEILAEILAETVGSVVHFIIAGLIVAPVMVALFVISASWFGRRKTSRDIATLGEFSCPFCGASYGPKAAAAAYADYEEDLREMWERARREGIKPSLADPEWTVICPQCHGKATFVPGTGELRAGDVT